MINFLKYVGIVFVLFIAAAFLSVKLPQIGLWVGLAFFILPVIAVFKPIPKIGLGSKGFNLALFLLVGLPTLTNSQSILKQQKTEYLAVLKADDPQAYLAELKKSNQQLWLSELSKIDPKAHKAELERNEAETKAKAAEKRIKECGEKNESTAYVMSQDAVKRYLKSPSTAKFPFINYVSSRAISGCQFEIRAYVDSQNGFGATLRSNYSATMQLNPKKGSWTTLDIKVR